MRPQVCRMKREHEIFCVEPDSIAARLGIGPGDFLVSINGEEMEDIFDYHFLASDERLELTVRKSTGEEQTFIVEKEYSQDLGIGFENGLMDEYRSCRNKCIFCFIDQMPPDMRETLYFKDDDSRLSFLQGNYVTLTNMSDADISRIIRYHLAPINISVHTTNPQLRCRMLNNRFAGEALEKIRTLYNAGIEMNGQIVLCKGVNDGAELERSIRDLAEFLPCMESVSVVPVGLTRYRQKLYPLEPFTKEDAKEVLAVIHRWQDICFARCGTHFIHAGDEWYLLAEEEFPEEERYDGYIQLENGVGMMRLLKEEFSECLRLDEEAARRRSAGLSGLLHRRKSGRSPERGRKGQRAEGAASFGIAAARTGGDLRKRHRLTIATGVLAAPLLGELTGAYMKLHPDREVIVSAIENRFFGERITVSGLITGQDLIGQLSGQELGECLLIPCNMLRSGESVFLDDVTLAEVSEALQVPVHVVKSDGKSLFEALEGIHE